ncbi:hypothetical protein GB931_00520 [Modestobacter sp. I12A-02628]|uniref:Uncharacterized protein n=1 Tax=Goekera deserti TaxID=2497753 RepID=A0A7K3WI85_9ACTN|nr:hypothetical protein [Goekera deserti]MPQ96431.1 hypothetical protein [Goekera deserti]NDI47256.1 hypothetical protein [Goekera deserti]NEL56086.1 hypothetical protein [Goekera deserti]
MTDAAAPPDLRLPSTGPFPLHLDTALAAVLGYARGRRPLRFRPPSDPAGTWVYVPAFGYERFDAQPATDDVDGDVLVAEALHGRLHPATWSSVRAALDSARSPAEAAVARAADRAFWELPADELSVLGEPGTVGAALREIGTLPHPEYVTAALHHRRPRLFPHVHRTTRLQLLPHVLEGDSGLHAVVHRELVANEAAFAELEAQVAELLGRRLTRLRLHDVLLWLSGSLRLTHAVALGTDTDEWRRHTAGS